MFTSQNKDFKQSPAAGVNMHGPTPNNTPTSACAAAKQAPVLFCSALKKQLRQVHLPYACRATTVKIAKDWIVMTFDNEVQEAAHGASSMSESDVVGTPDCDTGPACAGASTWHVPCIDDISHCSKK
jgi:hypothetical protein